MAKPGSSAAHLCTQSALPKPSAHSASAAWRLWASRSPWRCGPASSCAARGQICRKALAVARQWLFTRSLIHSFTHHPFIQEHLCYTGMGGTGVNKRTRAMDSPSLAGVGTDSKQVNKYVNVISARDKCCKEKDHVGAALEWRGKGGFRRVTLEQKPARGKDPAGRRAVQ